MRSLTPTLTLWTTLAGLATTGLFVGSCRQLPDWRAWAESQEEHDRLEEAERVTAERVAFNQCLTADLVASQKAVA